MVVYIFQDILHIIWFKNSGIFEALGQNLLSPPSWALTIMLVLRFLPKRKLFMYVYILGMGVVSVGYAYLVRNVGLFDFQPWFYPVFSYFTFFGWWSFAVWFFKKTSHLAHVED
jgi:hypothetical protein